MKTLRAKFRCTAQRLACTLFAALIFAPAAQAQVARVSAVQRIIETRSGDGGWRKARAGARLGVNDRLRTGKRSKADLKFTDGSLLRLGQLSSVEIRGAKSVALTGGQLLFSAIRPGTRIVAGAGAAEIKGSTGIVTLFENGSSEYILFSGAMDVISVQGPRIELPAGFQVTVSAEGAIGQPRIAPPFAFSSSPVRPDISTPPQSGPFVGSDIDILIRTEPERLINERAAEAILINNPVLSQGNPLIPARQNTGAPFPVPFPQLPLMAPTGMNRRNTTRELTPLPAFARRRSTLAPSLVPLFSNAIELNDRIATVTPAVLQLPPTAPAAPVPPETLQAGDMVEDASALDSLEMRAANRHLEEAFSSGGQVSGGDVSVIGALGDEGLRAYGGRVHAFSADGPWHVDLAAQSIRVRSGSPTIPDLDLTAISNATVTHRNRHGDVILGRQRFQEGPVQATLFGSLVRQGTREIMDAARVRPNVGKNNRLELAYLFDAFPRNLPYRIGGRQRGLYGRFATQGNMGRVGLNVLKYNNLPVPTSTGATIDFAVPLIRNQVELYGEVGRDTFRRRLTTAGLSFPGLYDRTDFDVYLEYANLRSSNVALRPPTELTLRVYRRITDNANLIASASRFYGSGSSVIIGVAFGGGSSTQRGLR